LVGGEPGIGKSTLLLQVSGMAAAQRGSVLYVSGEESPAQVKLRAERLGVTGDGVYFLPESDLTQVLEYLESDSFALVVVDSIQTLHVADVIGTPGSLSQVRECAWRLERWAKQSNVPVLVAGHVTKEGAIAGPGTLEHIADVVLYLEGESMSSYRVLRGEKNRFGPTNEVGIFEMESTGLTDVENPSEVFLSAYREESVGSVVVPVLEGSRPLLVEIQALTSPNSYSPPRRIASGVDFNRLLLILAVLTKRAGLKLFGQDVIVNITGGLRITETAVDLGIALAIASSFTERGVVSGMVALGEIGLSGELRGVPQMERRLSEAARLGFRSCLAPGLKSDSAALCGGMRLFQADSVVEALALGLLKGS